MTSKQILSTTPPFQITLDQYLESSDFREGVISNTKASWGGSGYTVELFPDGNWRNLWNNEIGNLYESPGVLLKLPVLDTEDMTEYIDGGASTEEDFLKEAFENEQEELKADLRNDLSEKLPIEEEEL